MICYIHNRFNHVFFHFLSRKGFQSTRQCSVNWGTIHASRWDWMLLTLCQNLFLDNGEAMLTNTENRLLDIKRKMTIPYSYANTKCTQYFSHLWILQNWLLYIGYQSLEFCLLCLVNEYTLTHCVFYHALISQRWIIHNLCTITIESKVLQKKLWKYSIGP